jgi:hypothetical protein
MENKLRSNSDWFVGNDQQDTQERIAAYMTTRTENPARDQLETLISALRDSGEAIDSEFLMDTLEQAFGDPHKEKNARQAFGRLRLRSAAEFATFQAEFFRLATQRKLPAEQWVEEFHEKLTDRLRMDMSRDVRRLKSDYNEFVGIARDLAREAAITDDRAAARAERKKATTATMPVKSREHTSPPMLPPRPSTVTSAPADQPTCFRCHKVGHLARNCTEKPVDQKAIELPADVDDEVFYDAADRNSSSDESEKVSL